MNIAVGILYFLHFHLISTHTWGRCLTIHVFITPSCSTVVRRLPRQSLLFYIIPHSRLLLGLPIFLLRWTSISTTLLPVQCSSPPLHKSIPLHFPFFDNFLNFVVPLILSFLVRGFAKLKKFQKSKNNLEVGGWVQVPFG